MQPGGGRVVGWGGAILDDTGGTAMGKITTDSDTPEEDQYGFERLMKIKALKNERLALQRAGSQAAYEALSPEEKILVDEKFREAAQIIAAQFGRSRPFKCESEKSLLDSSKTANAQDPTDSRG
ncbi:hypothetical protein [Pseudomonas sp. PMCC200344]|uniref:hypothetical protein n=1 Tax=Pseudomonas sp. PMCC200344 TaxID=3042028 RepID=UPI0024B3B660|nr:hypothetical protein [Pseudomonas sp. PMCC200344]